MADAFPLTLTHAPGVTITLDSTRLLIAFRAPHQRGRVTGLIQPFGLVLEAAKDPSGRIERSRRPATEVVNDTQFRFWAVSSDGRLLTTSEIDSLRSALQADLQWLGPVYRMPGTSNRDGLLCPVPDVLLIWYASTVPTDRTNVETFLSQLGMNEIPEKSKLLPPYHYYQTPTPDVHSAYDVRQQLLASPQFALREIAFENMPMVKPASIVPDDPLYPQQWNMAQIQAGGATPSGWDVSTGDAATVIAILDYGCDLNHPDLQFSSPGVNLATLTGDGGPVDGDPHGTCCAGIAAALFNNALGVAGVAGSCSILSLAEQNGADTEIASGINFAADNGASVISMSFGQPGTPTWNVNLIDNAIAHAYNDRGMILCAAAGNKGNAVSNDYPSRHPLVIACGASDQDDNRKTPFSRDGEQWASNYGVDTYLGQTTAISVMAPGVEIPSTDITGAAGFTPGDYYYFFNGTSSATPHVAGLAAALRSLYPALTNAQVRTIIERTAERVGGAAYGEVQGFPNGPRNQQMGYGRINMYRALDFADVYIKSFPADSGAEPSAPPGGDFWDASDIVVRSTDDGVFVPSDPLQSSLLPPGGPATIYVRVTNNGPNAARNLTVNCRIVQFAGLEFIYPDDWTNVDSTHLSPTATLNLFANLAVNGTAIAKFSVTAAQVANAWSFNTNLAWHPCILAVVTSDNDYAFQSSVLPLTQRKNNLAQRNLAVFQVAPHTMIRALLVAGHSENSDSSFQIAVNCPASLAGQPIELEVLPNDAPDIWDADDPPAFEITQVIGGQIAPGAAGQIVEISDSTAIIALDKDPNQLYPMALSVTIPGNATVGQQFCIEVSQLNAGGQLAGGVSLVYVVATNGTPGPSSAA